MRTQSLLIIGIIFSLFFNVQMAQSTTTYGLIENIYLLPHKQLLAAKLDTGATTSSIHATQINYFQHNGKTWVRFTIPATHHSAAIHYSAPLVSVSSIKLRPTPGLNITHENRPVVRMTVCLGGQTKTILVNLANRAGFQYPMLLGQQGIVQFNGVVDPSKKYTQPACAQ